MGRRPAAPRAPARATLEFDLRASTATGGAVISSLGNLLNPR
jgi:hypothetical protein